MPERRAALILELLGDGKHTLACAESLTGGLLTDAFVQVPGASAVLRGGVVAYATDLKASVLGVDPRLLAEKGAVDQGVAEQMAKGVSRRLGATHGVATTGVAGPDPQDGQPVGTVYIAVSTPDGVHSAGARIPGRRADVRRGAVTAALDLLHEVLTAPAG